MLSTDIGTSEQRNRDFKHIPIKMKKATSIIFLLKLMVKAPFLRLPKNSIIHAHRPDFMLPFILFCRKNPKVCTLHGIPDINIKTRKNTIIWGIYTSLERLSLGYIDKLIAVNQSTKDYYSDKKRNIKGKIVVVPVGIDTKMFKPLDRRKMREKYGFDQKETIILYVGRFSIEKGLDLLLEAFKDLKSEIPKARLILVGEGPEEKKLRKTVKTQGIESVTFIKPVTHEKIPEIINCADALALCSLFEGMPTVVLESLACGVPVVSTDVGGVNKVVVDGKTGQLVKDASRESIKNAIAKVVRNGRDAYINSCTTVAMQYSWEHIAERVMDVYAEIAQRDG